MARRDLSGAVDFRRLAAFTAGDLGVVEEVLGLFEEQADVWLRLLEGAAEDQGWRDAAHTLKGSALGLCADALADACARAEAQGDASPALRGVLVGRVRDEVERVRADIAAWRHERRLQELHGR